MHLRIHPLFRVCAMLLPAMAHAQRLETRAADLAITYTSVLANAGPNQCGCFHLSGGTAQVGIPLNPRWSVLADLSGSTAGSVNGGRTGLSLLTYTGGLRYRVAKARVHPFIEALAGGSYGFNSYFPNAANSASASGFAILAGGGLDLRLSRRVELRPLQADYLLTSLPNSTNNRQNNTRLSAGLLIRFPRHPGD